MRYELKEVESIPEGYYLKKKFHITNGHYFIYQDKPEHREIDGKFYEVFEVPEHKEFNRMWDSWFDTSTGEMMDSSEKVRSKEKEGLVMLTYREAQEEFKKSRRHIQEKFKRESNERFREKMIPVLKKNGLL